MSGENNAQMFEEEMYGERMSDEQTFDEVMDEQDPRFLSKDEIDLSATSIRKRYPLPREEASMFTLALIMEDVIFVLLGMLAASVFNGASALDDIIGELSNAGFGILSLEALSSVRMWAFALAGLAVTLALNVAVEAFMMRHSEKYRADMLENNQNFTGELIRMDIPVFFVLSLCVGIGEECLYRYGATALAIILFSALSITGMPAYIAATLLVSAVFALSHTNYSTGIAKLQLFASGLFFALTFALSGSLIAAILAHGLYDFTAFLIARRRIMSDEDPYGGKVPARLLTKKQAPKRP